MNRAKRRQHALAMLQRVVGAVNALNEPHRTLSCRFVLSRAASGALRHSGARTSRSRAADAMGGRCARGCHPSVPGRSRARTEDDSQLGPLRSNPSRVGRCPCGWKRRSPCTVWGSLWARPGAGVDPPHPPLAKDKTILGVGGATTPAPFCRGRLCRPALALGHRACPRGGDVGLGCQIRQHKRRTVWCQSPPTVQNAPTAQRRSCPAAARRRVPAAAASAAAASAAAASAAAAAVATGSADVARKVPPAA